MEDACTRHGARLRTMGADTWLFERAVRRVDPVDAVVADYATSICGRAARRREVRPGGPDVGVTWSIDGEVVVCFTPKQQGRSVVTIHEIALLQPLRKQLRSRHLAVAYRPR
jgi:hypothetical protein